MGDDFEKEKNKAISRKICSESSKLKRKMVLKALIFLSMVYTISSDLTDRVRHFETLSSSDLSHKIVKRGIDPNGVHKFNKIREVGFKTLGREFRLILSPKKGLLHPNFKAVEIDDDAVPTTSNNKTTTHKEKVINID